MVALALALGLWRLMGPPWVDIEYLPILLLAGGGAWLGAAAREGRAALGWRLVSIAWLGSAVAVVLWFIERVGSVPAVEPIATALWNGYYLLMVAGLVAMVPRVRTPGQRVRATLEAITVAAASGLLFYYFVWRHAPDLFTLVSNGIGEPAVLVAAAVLLSRDRTDPAERQLGAGALLATIADLGHAAARSGLDIAGGADVALCVSAALIAIAGLQRPGWRQPLRLPIEVALRGLGHLPSMSAVAVLAVLVAAALGNDRGALAVLAIGSAAVVALLLVGLAMARYQTEVEEDARAAQTERLTAIQRYATLGQIAGAAVHDLNNMICVVDAVAMELRDLTPVPEGVADLEAASRRAASVCRDLLSLGARRPGDATDVARVVHDLASLLRRVVPRTLEFEVAADGPLVAAADRAQLEMAIVNLVTNARDATVKGAVRVRAEPMVVVAGDVHARGAVTPGRWVRIAVSDTGSGMPPELVARVTQPFFTSKGARGTGIGLAQVADLARQAHGHVVIDSTLGAGTEVSVFLRPV